jgi:signal transduction histidine kinase
MRSSIKTQIFIIIFVLSLVPLGIIIFSALHQRNNDLKAESRIAVRLCNEVSNEQKVLLSGAEQLLNSLAYSPCILNRDAEAAHILFAELVKKNPEATDIFVVDTTGWMWAAALPMNRVMMVNERRYFKNAMATGNFSSGEFTIGKLLNRPVISFGYPIKDSAGKIRDVVCIAFTLEKYNQILKSQNMPADSSLVLTDHNGTILFDAGDPKFIGRKDGEAIFRRMTEGPDKGNFEATGITGKKRYFAYQKLSIKGEQTPYMYVRIGLLKETVANKISSTLMLNTGIMMGVMLLTFGFAAHISKREIVDKIVALRDATLKIAQGNLDVHVSDAVSGGELGELGRAFDEMARKLAEGVADRERSEAILREKKAAEAANLVKSRLLRTIAHEFRTPLGLLTGSTDIFDRYWDRLSKEKRSEQSEHIRSATQQLTNLINSVISFNQMETDRQGNAALLHDIGELCRTIATEVKTVWGAGKEFKVTIAEDCGTILLDEFLFRRVLENLLTNAFRYTPPGGDVSLDVRRKNNRLGLEISDTGIGIPEEDQKLIFDAFHRSRNVEGRRGLGLGLSIVSEALSQMGGTISVTSRTGEGTTMRVEIPVDVPPPLAGGG